MIIVCLQGFRQHISKKNIVKITHSAYSYTFTQGRNNMHAQKNMNVYDVFTFQCTNGLMIV